MSQSPYTKGILFLSISILIMSVLSLVINIFYTKYTGNNYFPDNVFALLVFLILTHYGLKFICVKDHHLNIASKELIYFYIVMCIVVISTNAVQYTPYHPIDKQILNFEKLFSINMKNILSTMQHYPTFKSILKIIYDSLSYQMSLIPIIVILSGQLTVIRAYYFLLLLTTLIGFSFYYFFPTVAPAGIIDSKNLFLDEQLATGIKFFEIHQHQSPSTNAGGLIALPSFHVIWAILCLGLLKKWPFLQFLLTLWNIMLIISCVLLGWHYCSDLIGSAFVLCFSYIFLNWYQNNFFINFKFKKAHKKLCI